jgi:hypothetical protein
VGHWGLPAEVVLLHRAEDLEGGLVEDSVNLGLLVLEDGSQSLHQNRAYLIEVKVHVVEDVVLQVVGEKNDSSFFHFDVSGVQKGIVKGIDQ